MRMSCVSTGLMSNSELPEFTIPPTKKMEKIFDNGIFAIFLF